MKSLVLLFALGCSSKSDVDVGGTGLEADDIPCSYYLDADGDGYGDSAERIEQHCDDPTPADYVAVRGDCDDADATIYPEAEELCDGLDNNCDASDDLEFSGVWYQDSDLDGYGVGDGVEHCDDPGEGWSENADDCDDERGDYFPGAPTECDGNDRNCDGVDDGLDADGDGYRGCEECDDTRPEVNPGEREVCDEENLDEDCDGAADDDDPEGTRDALVWYYDVDGDGFGDDDIGGEQLCDPPSDDMINEGGDCDDTDPGVNPDAQEVCDPHDVDEDCNRRADNEDDNADDAGKDTWYRDRDEDGYGDDADTVFRCDPSANYPADVGGDCDDRDEDIWPGAPDTWYDGVDSDCAGDDDYDQDLDGWGIEDCDDDDPSINPDASEIYRNGTDEDCDGFDPFELSYAGAGDLVVSEVMADTSATTDADGEWFEIYNTSSRDLDLYGLLVHDDDSGGNEFTVDENAVIGAGGYLVFVRVADPSANGGIEGVDWEHGSFGFANSGTDEIWLEYDEVLFDTFEYNDAWELPLGASLNLDTGSLTAGANDNVNNWCRGADAYGDGDLGTPGEANRPCYSHDDDIQPIWNTECSKCHAGDSPSADLNLAGSAWDDLLSWTNPESGLLLVEPASPEDSYLWHKLSGTQEDVGGDGTRMPRGGSLGEDDMDLIHAWILQGAAP